MRDLRGRQRALHQRRGRHRDHRRRAIGQGLQGLQPFTQGIGMRQLVLMRQDLPIRIKPRGRIDVQQPQPRLHILLQRFLLLELGGDQHHRAARFRAQRRGKMRPAGGINIGAGHGAARRNAFTQFLAECRCGKTIK